MNQDVSFTGSLTIQYKIVNSENASLSIPSLPGSDMELEDDGSSIQIKGFGSFTFGELTLVYSNPLCSTSYNTGN